MFSFTEEQVMELLWWAGLLEETTLPQGIGALKQKTPNLECDIAFCCLGIYLEEKKPDIWGGIDQYDRCFFFQEHGESEECFLPDLYVEQMGLDQGKLHSFFAYLNDTGHFSFKEISQEIHYLVQNGVFTPSTQRFYKEALENQSI